jgi:hypothetical protein
MAIVNTLWMASEWRAARHSEGARLREAGVDCPLGFVRLSGKWMATCHGSLHGNGAVGASQWLAGGQPECGAGRFCEPRLSGVRALWP